VTSDQHAGRDEIVAKTIVNGSNAAKMGEWHTASRIERQKKTKKPKLPAPKR